MYAVIKAGGKQQRVQAGDRVEVEFMHADPGESVEFKPLVVFDDDGKAHVGKDLAQARVVARLLGDKKGDKVKVFKYRPKSGYKRSMGHRQLLTLLEVQEVALSPDKVDRRAEEAEEKPAVKEPAAEKPAVKEAAAKKPAAKKTAAKKPAAKASAKKPAAKAAAKKTAAKSPAKKSGGAKKT
jgi:large subunit ribosomal protein L21